MRIRTGHGPDDWAYGPPAYAGSVPLRGTLVVGLSGSAGGTRADLSSSQVYRQRHPDRVAAYQKKYRAKVRAEVAAIRGAA